MGSEVHWMLLQLQLYFFLITPHLLKCVRFKPQFFLLEPHRLSCLMARSTIFQLKSTFFCFGEPSASARAPATALVLLRRVATDGGGRQGAVGRVVQA